MRSISESRAVEAQRRIKQRKTLTLQRVRIAKQFAVAGERADALSRSERSEEPLFWWRMRKRIADSWWKNQVSGGDALRGHTRSHPEHDG